MNLYQRRIAEAAQREQSQPQQQKAKENTDTIRKRITETLMNRPDLLNNKHLSQSKEEIKMIISQAFRNAENLHLRREADRYIAEIYHDICEYGPLTPLLEDPTITEIKVSGFERVKVEREGQESRVDTQFRNREHLMEVIEKIVAPIGRKVDMSNPIVDAFLPDKSRVNIVLDPIAVNGPFMNIRKFVKQLTVEELCRRGAFPEWVIPIFEFVAKARFGFIVTGGTGSGKTTLLNGVSQYIQHNHDIVTIQDVIELDLQHPEVRDLLTRPANAEGKGEITTKHLLRTAMRMRPDRIITGEVRDDSIDEALNAMITGHDGSAFSMHLESPDKVQSRIEYLSKNQKIAEVFADAVQIILHVQRLDDGRRRLTHVTQVAGIKNRRLQLENLLVFDRANDQLSRTDIPFHKTAEMQARGIAVPEVLLKVGSQWHIS